MVPLFAFKRGQGDGYSTSTGLHWHKNGLPFTGNRASGPLARVCEYNCEIAHLLWRVLHDIFNGSELLGLEISLLVNAFVAHVLRTRKQIKNSD